MMVVIPLGVNVRFGQIDVFLTCAGSPGLRHEKVGAAVGNVLVCCSEPCGEVILDL